MKIDIPGYPTLLASSTGDIYLKSTGEKKAVRDNGKGYLRITISRGKHRPKQNLRVHRLIAAAFLGESHYNVNHKNGIKSDNRPENIEYCTQQENMKHAFENGLLRKAYSKIPRPVKTPKYKPFMDVFMLKRSKFDIFQILAIRTLYGHLSISKLAKHYKTSEGSVSAILGGYKPKGLSDIRNENTAIVPKNLIATMHKQKAVG